MDYIQIVNLLWICPLQIGISIYLLWQNIQYGALAGLFVMLSLFPINFLIGAKIKKKQTKLFEIRDKKVKLINEVLNGIKVIKLYAWEPSFLNIITQYRRDEINVLKHQAYLYAGVTFAFNSAPLFVGRMIFHFKK